MTCLEILYKTRKQCPYMTTWDVLEEVDSIMVHHKWWKPHKRITNGFTRAIVKTKHKKRGSHEIV
jgi:hypothetical protein